MGCICENVLWPSAKAVSCEEKVEQERIGREAFRSVFTAFRHLLSLATSERSSVFQRGSPSFNAVAPCFNTGNKLNRRLATEDK